MDFCLLAVIIYLPIGERGILQIFDEKTGKLLSSKSLHISSILFIQNSIDGGTIITAGADFTIKLWILSK